MEKYSVKQSPAKVSSSKARTECPKCGYNLAGLNTSYVKHCPRCGTEPWESKDGQPGGPVRR